jgi:predicted NAD/FAD-dependent oxidoreductase
MNRREFLCSSAALTLAGCGAETRPPLPPGAVRGDDPDFGHRLREGAFPPAVETRRTTVLIVGGGIGGLSAAWKLARAGVEDFLVCELGESAGGNARWGENAVSAYPWAAHYLPLPTRESRAVRELLADLGALEGAPQAARPRFDERYLCNAPQERLYRHGVWQEGLMPQAGLSPAERAQAQRFLETMSAFKARRGADGRKAFALPLELSSRDPALLALDRQTMRAWLLAQGLDSEPLHWYVDYACRDDYGTPASQTSAWAGIHYFACRDGEAQDTAGDIVLTAPEGNGWIVRRLAERIGRRLLTGALCIKVGNGPRRAHADFYLRPEQRTLRIDAEQLIYAAPAFTLPAVWPEAPPELLQAARAVDYAPWLTANLTLTQLPEERHGAPLAWDNVLYDGPGLGYVVATHQNLRTRPGPTVLTYYRALAQMTPQAGRAQLLQRTRDEWTQAILGELERAHPNLRAICTGVEICRFGHAMARPRPGALWHGRRGVLGRGYGRIRLAHADLSGISLFEEANYRGVLAAERALRSLGTGFTTSL